MPLVGVLADMERAGIAVDAEHLADLQSRFAGEVKAAAQEAYAVVGREFNLGSPKQLQAILFDELGLPKTKRIKTGYTTDADALQALYAQTGHPLLAHLLRHRDVSKLLVTVEGLQKSVADDGRIHTTFNQTVAATGRLSSTDPNLQNIPIRTQEGRTIRQAFVVGPQFESLMTADYSQVEMRIMAHLSEDDALVAAFESGEDLHTTVAARVFGVPPEEVDAVLRGRIKAMSYGLAYGLSAFGLSQQLGITPEEARGLMDEYFTRFGGVRDYLASVVDEARRTGYTETLLGRRRYLPDLTSDNRQRREMAERMALNAPIQGSAADVVKVAMLNVHRALAEERPAVPDAAAGARRARAGGRAGRARAGRAARPGPHGGGVPAAGAAGRLGRPRPHLGRRGALTGAVMTRVVVAGISGVGKTTLARRLAAARGLRHVEVDALFHGPGWQRRPDLRGGRGRGHRRLGLGGRLLRLPRRA